MSIAKREALEAIGYASEPTAFYRRQAHPIVRVIGIMVLVALPLELSAADAVIPPIDMELDGYLREWGPAERIPLAPGGKEIGLRGVFSDEGDHEADAFAMWDATYLYFAVAVSDDQIDFGRVRPQDKIWHGPQGARKDRMFYFDHLKIFVRGQGAAFGHHVWVGPKWDDLPPYAWGYQQRQAADEDVPVLLGSEQIESVYTFEVAIPWSWLGIDPGPGMFLRTSILLVDSDLPGVEIEEKIAREQSKWIWWDGDLKLTGELPVQVVDLPPVEGPTSAEDARQQEAEETPATALARAGFRASDDTLSAPQVPPPPDTIRPEPAPVHLRDRFEKALRGEQPAREELPAWIRAIPRDELQETHVVSYVSTIRKTLARLVRGRTTAHTRVIIIDMALEAGTMKFLARGFLLGLLAAVQAELEEGKGSDVSATVSRAAGDVGVNGGTALQFVRMDAKREYEGLEKEKKMTTADIIAHAAKRSGLERDKANELLEALVGTD